MKIIIEVDGDLIKKISFERDDKIVKSHSQQKQNNKCEWCGKTKREHFDGVYSKNTYCEDKFKSHKYLESNSPTLQSTKQSKAGASEEEIKLERTDISKSGLITPLSSPSSMPYTPLTKESEVEERYILNNFYKDEDFIWLRHKDVVSAFNGLREDDNHYIEHIERILMSDRIPQDIVLMITTYLIEIKNNKNKWFDIEVKEK